MVIKIKASTLLHAEASIIYIPAKTPRLRRSRASVAASV